MCAENFYKGLKARQMIAQGKANPRATPWVSISKIPQTLKGRKFNSTLIKQISSVANNECDLLDDRVLSFAPLEL